MAWREFGKLGSSIWGSRRFNRLGTDGARLAFCYLISTDHGNRIGTYKLNPIYMAADRSISPAQAEAELIDLATVGLIDYDAGENMIHIRRWFVRNAIQNPNDLTGALRAVDTLPASRLRGLVAADILVATFTTSADWEKPDTRDKIRFTATRGCADQITKFAATEYLQEITKIIDPEPLQNLFEHLSIPLPNPFNPSEGVSIPLGNGLANRIETTERENQREKEIQKQREKQREKQNQTQSRDARSRAPARAKPKPSKKPAPASALKRAGAGRKTSNDTAVLQSMADLVKSVNAGNSPQTAILAPDAKQLETLITRKLITTKERDRYIDGLKP